MFKCFETPRCSEAYYEAGCVETVLTLKEAEADTVQAPGNMLAVFSKLGNRGRLIEFWATCCYTWESLMFLVFWGDMVFGHMDGIRVVIEERRTIMLNGWGDYSENPLASDFILQVIRDCSISPTASVKCNDVLELTAPSRTKTEEKIKCACCRRSLVRFGKFGILETITEVRVECL